MAGRIAKSGRSVSMLSIDITGDGGHALGFANATFMAAPNPSLRMPTIVRDDEGLLKPHPPRPRGALRRTGRLRAGGPGAGDDPAPP